jgi:prepilin-type N-terminal cleavage/methylation domain-containing protein
VNNLQIFNLAPAAGDAPEGRGGFTLIELLVVVAIIVALLALLTPALDKALQQAEIAACAARLHGIANAGEQYRLDHKRAFPTLRLVNAEPDDVYYTYHYWGGKAGALHADENLAHPRLINRYVGLDRKLTDRTASGGAVDLFACPSDQGAQGGWGGAYHVGTSFYQWGTSYFYNASGNRNNTTGLYRKSRISNPPSRVIVANDWTLNAWFIYDQFLQPYAVMYWHNETELGWGNAHFADGHVAYTQAVLVDRPGGVPWNPQFTTDYVNGPDYTFAPHRQ